MTGRFKPRPTEPVGVVTINGWRLKRYDITLDGKPVAADVNIAVHDTLARALPSHEDGDGVGFLIVHHGAQQVWVLADLWQGDIISQHTFYAALDSPTRFRAVEPGGPTACVWELVVHAFERDAYVAHVLDPVDGPDFEAYLRDQRIDR